MMEQQIHANTKQSQVIVEKVAQISNRLLRGAFETFKLSELEWKTCQMKKRYIAMCLLRVVHEKFTKLLNAQKARRHSIHTILKAKVEHVQAINDLLDEILTEQTGSSSIPPPQLSSTHLGGLQATMSPSKSGENQFIHILNQFLIATLRRLDHDLNGLAESEGFHLKSHISTSFNVNLDIYVDLVKQIKSKFSARLASKPFQAAFNAAFNTIWTTIRYIYEQETVKNKILHSFSSFIPHIYLNIKINKLYF